ncbi:transposon Ty3-I Gag-Pol polyprotein [Trichonephila clavipes]|nr:transposon Ty3-I Gag-Pol polyprotein [Trichonephila clavipes]
MQKKVQIIRIARWALQLEEFDYEIEHRAGSRMKHVDVLSRYPVMMKYLNGRELIVTPKAMQAELIKLIHENGHFSVGKTEKL